MNIHFSEVSIKATKRWKENGKTRTQTRRFCQTLNPFNKNAAGNLKTRAEILVELAADRDAWLALTPIASGVTLNITA